MKTNPESVTILLKAWSAGDEAAGNQLIAVVYQELRRLADRFERTADTAQPEKRPPDSSLERNSH